MRCVLSQSNDLNRNAGKFTSISFFSVFAPCCCRRQHTILNMKYCVYVCPVSLAELCIAERELGFACTNDVA